MISLTHRELVVSKYVKHIALCNKEERQERTSRKLLTNGKNNSHLIRRFITAIVFVWFLCSYSISVKFLITAHLSCSLRHSNSLLWKNVQNNILYQHCNATPPPIHIVPLFMSKCSSCPAHIFLIKTKFFAYQWRKPPLAP